MMRAPTLFGPTPVCPHGIPASVLTMLFGWYENSTSVAMAFESRRLKNYSVVVWKKKGCGAETGVTRATEECPVTVHAWGFIYRRKATARIVQVRIQHRRVRVYRRHDHTMPAQVTIRCPVAAPSDTLRTPACHNCKLALEYSASEH